MNSFQEKVKLLIEDKEAINETLQNKMKEIYILKSKLI